MRYIVRQGRKRGWCRSPSCLRLDLYACARLYYRCICRSWWKRHSRVHSFCGRYMRWFAHRCSMPTAPRLQKASLAIRKVCPPAGQYNFPFSVFPFPFSVRIGRDEGLFLSIHPNACTSGHLPRVLKPTVGRDIYLPC